MTYRAGTLNDVDAICELIKAAIEKMEEQGIHQWDELYPDRSDFISDIEKNTLYVAAEGDELVAIYVISTECDDAYFECSWNGELSKACVIHRLCVSSRFQNKGVGQTILSHIEEHLRELGYESARLDVFTENPYALRLYRKNGYEERGYADWRKGRFILMEKQLYLR